MLGRILIVLNLAGLLGSAVVVDRVAIIVGPRAIKASDIDRDLRVTQLLNGEAADFSAEAKRKAADRLIDQELMRQEMMHGGYTQPSEKDVNAFLHQLRTERFKGSDAQFQAALARNGLSEDQLRRSLFWQLTVLRFIEQRFRPAVLVTDEDVQAFYEEHRADLQKAHPQNNSLEAMDPKIREIIAGERVNERFEEWVQQRRRRIRIEYRDPALREGVSK